MAIVVYEELAGSPTISYTRGKGGNAKQVFRMAWSDQDNFLANVFPSPYIRGNRIIIPPARTFPSKVWMIAHSAEVEPFDAESPSGLGEVPNYYPGGAKVTVNFETPEYDTGDKKDDGPAGPDAITFVTYKTSIGGEFLTYPSNSLRWDQPSDTTLTDYPGNPIAPRYTQVGDDMQVSVIIPLIEHSLTWPQVAFPAWSSIRECIGRVNAYKFAGCQPETLLFLGAEASRDITSEGIRCWNLEYKFSEKNQNPNRYDTTNPQGWNHFLRPDGLSAGTFMRMRKRLPGGFTSLRAAGTIADLSISIMAPTSFPRAGSYKVMINGADLYDVTAGFGTNTWNISQAGVPGLVGNYPKGASVAQYYRSTLRAAMTAGTSNVLINVNDASVFPKGGQYLLKIDNEIVAVFGGQTTTNLVVFRGCNGTKAVAHNIGANVDQFFGNVYDLADFSTLFLSGLITG